MTTFSHHFPDQIGQLDSKQDAPGPNLIRPALVPSLF